MSAPSGYAIGRGEDGLTQRERQVLFLLREGHSNAEIGRRLGMSKQRVGQVKKALVDKGTVVVAGDRVLVEAVRRD